MCNSDKYGGVCPLDILSDKTDDNYSADDAADSDYDSLCSCVWQASPANSITSDSGVSEIEFDADVLLDKYFLEQNGVTAEIPSCNKSGYSKDKFSLHIIHDVLYIPDVALRTFHAGYVVSLEPHGTRFYGNSPALISLPLWFKVEDDDVVVCLCSNTPEGVTPQWEQLPNDQYTIDAGRVLIEASHFSLFTAIVVKPQPETRQRMSWEGGTVLVPGVPGLEVNFQKGSLTEDIEAHVKVYCDIDDSPSSAVGDTCLASPIVMVGPHGCNFNRGSNPVLVTLPIPEYDIIRQKYGSTPALSVWQSSTSEEEPHMWERIYVDCVVKETTTGIITVTFPVSHFSFFKIVWEVISNSLYEAKSTLSYLYPYVSFSMMCQASMEENKDTSRFGLEIICYRSDKRLPESSNYKHRVGCSVKPKLVKPGRILVRLKSEMFDADVEAGEDTSLIKEEGDFRGREFDKQFACRFRQNANIERGTFGKVIVERLIASGQTESLFEFNLNKTGYETENIGLESTSDRWSVVAIKELAGTLHITEDDNWKRFSRCIGFTNKEIKSKLQYSADPFLTMMNLYQARGGTPEEFVQALYEVSRELQVAPVKESGSPTGSLLGLKSWPFGGSPGGEGNASLAKYRTTDANSDTTGTPSSSSRKRSNPKSGGGNSASKRRRRFSDMSETMSSSENESQGRADELSQVQSEELRRDTRKLRDSDMWEISAHMNVQKWRALGRRLKLQECTLSNVEDAHKVSGYRECAYFMLLEWKSCMPKKCTLGNLYTCLQQENMCDAAKRMAAIALNDNPE